MATPQLLSLIVIALAMSHMSAQAVPQPATTTPPPLDSVAQAYLDAHNKARAEVGVQPLRWSATLANDASLHVWSQRDKQSCTFANMASGKYGGNQYWSGSSVLPQVVVEWWVDEKKYYNYATNTCSGDNKCGVYTQVVWKKSLELGCAQASCKDNSTLAICFYNPPGNFLGERPY